MTFMNHETGEYQFYHLIEDILLKNVDNWRITYAVAEFNNIPMR